MTLGIRGWRRHWPAGDMAMRGESRVGGTGRLVFGIRPRLVLLVLVALLPAPLLFIHQTEKARDELVATAQTRALQLARSWADNHDALMREADLLLQAVARDEATPRGDEATCSVALSRLAGQVNWQAPLAIIDHQATVLCGGNNARATSARLDWMFLADLFESRTLQISQFRPDGEGRMIAFAGLVLPGIAPGEPAAQRAAIAAIDLADIQRRTAPAADGTSYDVTLIDRTGIVLARDPANGEGVGQRLGTHPLMPDLMIRTEGAGSGSGPDGVPRIFAFVQLPQTGAKLIVGLTREAILGPAERENSRLFLLLGIVALATIIGAWLLAELSVVHWVVRLGRVAEAFGAARFDQRLRVPPSAGEFATLARSFNRMADALAARHRDLEAARSALETRGAALAASERRFRDIAEVAGDFFWERDPDGRYTFASDRFTEATGIPAEALLGKLPEHRSSFLAEGPDYQLLGEAFAARRPFRNLTLRTMLPDGETRWWRVSGKPIFDARGGFLGYRGAGNEVTAEIRAETEMVAAKEAAEAASRAKTEFLATMSHELRTPLNAIIGFAEIMQAELKGPLGSDAYRDYAADILNSGRHLLSLISDVLDVAKADAGRLELATEPVDLKALAATTVRLLCSQAEARGVRVDLTDEPREVIIEGDERRLRQILLNIIGNGIKFTPAEGSVRIALAAMPESVRISIRDTGIGIAEEHLPHLVEAFRQVDQSLSRRHEGTGLGLAITDRLVRLHGGRLSIRSRLGEGTEVIVELPRRRTGATPSLAAD